MDTATNVDGRTARKLSNRNRILDVALEAASGPGELSIEDLAERAGVSVRSVYNHFPTARDLVAGMYERGTELMAPLLEGLPTAEVDFEVRVVEWTQIMAEVLERIAGMRWRALQAESRYPDLQPELAALRELHRVNVHETFPELDEPAQHAVVALTDSLGWRALRRHQGLSTEEAREAIADTIRSFF